MVDLGLALAGVQNHGHHNHHNHHNPTTNSRFGDAVEHAVVNLGLALAGVQNGGNIYQNNGGGGGGGGGLVVLLFFLMIPLLFCGGIGYLIYRCSRACISQHRR